ncbi:hypothetical protein [Actinomadura rubrisoli]|uniref:Alkaline shock response membrane anchor protein AmaP n=1 Tax=Actinomadura rubrisoli TaxID=2530368 RepID=A0A4R5A1D8_9ACTN|nr:hypothetical protein [Actinomadura rubrisoli]TDD64740.1 hypothetical protein E1298_42075 [Actinomadura rubrisoli]
MRVAIAVTGTVLLTCGAGALVLGLGGFDGLGDLAARPPLDPALVRFADGNPWLLPAAASVAALLSLAGQLWLVVQGRALVHQWRPDVDPHTREAARDAAGALVRDAGALPSVREVRVRLTGTLTRPRLLLNVVCDRDAVLGEVYGELGAGPVERYRRTVGMPDLPAIVRFRMTSPHAGHRRPRQPDPETA